MEYIIKRLDLTVARQFSQPAFDMPSKTPDLVRSLFQAINPRFPLRLGDLRSYGGTSYADVRLEVVVLAGRVHLEVVPDGYTVRFMNLGETDADLKTLQDLVELADESIRDTLSEASMGGRAMSGSAWIECDGGLDAVDAMLRERGNKSLDLNSGIFKHFDKKYTIQATCQSSKGLNVNFSIQRSEMEIGHLFIQASLLFDIFYETQDLAAQFDAARIHFEDLLARLGLERSVEVAS